MGQLWEKSDKEGKGFVTKEECNKMVFSIMDKLGDPKSFGKTQFDKAYELVDKAKTKKVSKE